VFKFIGRLIKHEHRWIPFVRKGEEEHGKSTGVRICTKCGKKQYSFYDRFTYRTFWKDYFGF